MKAFWNHFKTDKDSFKTEANLRYEINDARNDLTIEIIIMYMRLIILIFYFRKKMNKKKFEKNYKKNV